MTLSDIQTSRRNIENVHRAPQHLHITMFGKLEKRKMTDDDNIQRNNAVGLIEYTSGIMKLLSY